ncbi:MAG: efflux RND transporter periplasmic adaptor subunit [Hyphomonadaceae bacterium]|nr:efflux RND transporter periplasmic adaptor subunit [Hyphomonadaceae bacterium]
MNDKTDLLKSLKIERTASDEQEARFPGWVAPAGVGALALVVGVAAGWFLKPAPPAPPAPPVETAQTGSGASVARGGLVASGYVVARRQATVAAEVTGRLLEVRIEEGQRVRRGEIIAVLEPTLARADSGAASARAAAAEADYAEAQRVLVRTRTLADQGFASDAAMTTAQARHDAALAQRNAARSDAQRASAQLARYEIRAPFSGVVVNKSAQPGEIISPVSAGGGFTRTGICTIVDMSSLEIEVDVSEAYIARVAEGQRVEATLDAYPGETFPARVIATIPAADRSRATVRVRIGFDQLDPRILPEMAISVRFLDEAT